ncbi:Dynamin-2A [Platanthera zijinensis]|uniref:Dynamin-2A n=1 Tax=Platanthera zijinensis TaxID=2320716 RepID=A0AAP0B376_9ASPA
MLSGGLWLHPGGLRLHPGGLRPPAHGLRPRLMLGRRESIKHGRSPCEDARCVCGLRPHQGGLCPQHVHRVLIDIVSSAANATPGLGRYPPFKREVVTIASDALDKFRNEAKKMVVALVDMERAFVPPQHFIRLVQRSYVCYSPTDNKLIVSTDVTFLEDQPFHYSPSIPSPPSTAARLAVPVTIPSLPPPPTPHPVPSLPPPPLRVYTRCQSRTTSLQQVSSKDDIPRLAGPASTSTAHPLANYVSLHRLSPPLHHFAVSLSSISISNSVQKAFQHSRWRTAMKDEMTSLWANQT